MESLSGFPRVERCRFRVLSLAMQGLWLLVVGAVLCAPSAVSATNASQRFQLVGSGTLNLDQPVQSGGSVRLKATLTSKDASLAASSPVQVSGRFALSASLGTASLVCYNDTIFRDSFDGTGF